MIYINQSGRTMKEMEEDAQLFYVAIDPNKKPFVLMHCYLELKKYPKWQIFSVSRKKQKDTPDASLGTTSNDNDFGAWTADLAIEQRPVGMKQGKNVYREVKLLHMMGMVANYH